MKQYRVEVMEHYNHGHHGKERFQVWGLSATSKKNACDFAYDIVAGMTWREIFADKENPDSTKLMWMPWEARGQKGLDETIGYEWAETYFSYRAEVDWDAE